METQDAHFQAALKRLRAIHASVDRDPELREILGAKDEVLQRYGPLFQPDRVESLREEDFRSFLYFENNRHWTGLYRQVGRLTADWERLRSTLALLVDEERPIAERFDEALGRLKGLGKALATAILLVAYPDRYGVWNNPSEAGLRTLELWPQFEPGVSPGKKYEAINRVLNRLSHALDVDLWTLDALIWRAGEREAPFEEGESEASAYPFRFERHLHEFLLDNWENTELGAEWQIYAEPDGELLGSEYPTDVGKIDILARHRDRQEWLVIELKRNQSTDATVGQLLRYVGWVEQHLAKPGERVWGMIIAQTIDRATRYAVRAVGADRILLRCYRLDFRLVDVPVDVVRGEGP